MFSEPCSPKEKFPWQPKQWACDIHQNWLFFTYYIVFFELIKTEKWVTEWNICTERKCHVSNRRLFAIVQSQHASCWNSSDWFTTALLPGVFLFYNDINVLHWYDNDSWTSFVLLSIMYLSKVSTYRES